MKDYTEEFCFESLMKFEGVFPDSFDANIDFAFDGLIFIRKLEGDNIGVVVVVKVLLIHLKESLIRAKDIVQGLERFTFLLKNLPDEFLKPGSFFKCDWRFKEEVNN